MIIADEKIKNLAESIMKSRTNSMYFRFKDIDDYVFGVKTKYINPIILLTSYKGFGGTEINENVTSMCITVEEIHKWIQILDDFYDNDTMRHGRPAVYVKYGIEDATMYSSILLANAFSRLKDIDKKYRDSTYKVLLEGVCELCEGESLDSNLVIGNKKIKDIEKDYEKITSMKTGSQPKLCSRLGGVLASAEDYDRMDKYHEKLGYCGQMCDDMLDLVKDPKSRREPGSDLKNYKITVLYIQAKKDGIEAEYLDICDKFARNEISINDVIKKFDHLGLISSSIEKIEKTIEEVIKLNRFDGDIGDFYDELPYKFLKYIKKNYSEKGIKVGD